MTRIVLCANNIDELGGAQKVVRVLADGFGARSHEVLVVGVTPFEPEGWTAAAARGVTLLVRF